MASHIPLCFCVLAIHIVSALKSIFFGYLVNSNVTLIATMTRLNGVIC